MKFISNNPHQYYCTPETMPSKHLVLKQLLGVLTKPHQAPVNGEQTTQHLPLPIPVSSWERNQAWNHLSTKWQLFELTVSLCLNQQRLESVDY